MRPGWDVNIVTAKAVVLDVARDNAYVSLQVEIKPALPISDDRATGHESTAGIPSLLAIGTAAAAGLVL